MMRVLQLIVVLFIFAAVSGCSRSGDFTAFVVSEVVLYGGRTNTNVSLPKLKAQWTIQRDRNGFQTIVRGVSFSAVDGMLRQALGDPMQSGISAGDDDEGELPYSNWAARDIGVAIIMIGYPDRIDLVCVAPQPLEEILRRFPESFVEDRP